MGEAGVVEPLDQGAGAGAEPEDEPASREPVEGGGGHRQRARGAAPDRQDASDELDAAGARRGLGEQQGRVQPPALGQGEGLVAELVGELGRAQDDVVAGLHGREGHAAGLGVHAGPPSAPGLGGGARKATAARQAGNYPSRYLGELPQSPWTEAHQAAIWARDRTPRRWRMRSTWPSAERSAIPSRRSGGWSGRQRPGPRPGAGGR